MEGKEPKESDTREKDIMQKPRRKEGINCHLGLGGRRRGGRGIMLVSKRGKS